MWKWLHKLGSPPWFYRISGRWLPWLAVASAALLLVGIGWGLLIAPPDYQQGHTVRIMYIHVPAAILAQSAYLMLAGAGLVVLVWRVRLADMFAEACAPVGASMTVLALATGSIWGKPTWGTYWEWDARLTSVLILLFLYIGVIALRAAIREAEAAARACAILAVVGVVNIPIIKYSVEWWNTLHQPASFRVTEKPTMPAEMWLPLLPCVLGLYLFFFTVVLMRTRNNVLRRDRRKSWAQDEIHRLNASGETEHGV